MVDVLTRKQRSFNMSRIKSGNTTPEAIIRKALRNAGLKHSHSSYIFGKPDIIFKKPKIAVFIDGCFWHKCPKCFVTPATRKSFWMNKIGKNIKRDKEVNQTLKKKGWRVIRFWEHHVRKNTLRSVLKIRKELGR